MEKVMIFKVGSQYVGRFTSPVGPLCPWGNTGWTLVNNASQAHTFLLEDPTELIKALTKKMYNVLRNNPEPMKPYTLSFVEEAM